MGDREPLTANSLNDNNPKGADAVEAVQVAANLTATLLPRSGCTRASLQATALLCSPSCLFNYETADCETQFRCPNVNKRIIFTDLSLKSGQFDLHFMAIQLHYLSCNSLLNHTEPPIPRESLAILPLR